MAVTDNGDQVGRRTAALTHGNGSVVTLREDFVVMGARRNLAPIKTVATKSRPGIGKRLWQSCWKSADPR